MGLISSRLHLDHFTSSHSHSERDGSGGQVYLLNKDYFSNYFLMGGERFEINDPDYIFGDICDLNFLSRTKPFPLPYKQAQQNLLTALNAKQKTNTKVSARISRIPYAFERITGSRTTTAAATTDSSRPPNGVGGSSGHRQALKTHSSTSSIGYGFNNKEPSKPLVMLINIRKETLRLVKSSGACNVDIDLNSLSDSISCDDLKSERSAHKFPTTQTIHQTSKQLSRSQISGLRQATPEPSPREAVQASSRQSSNDHLNYSTSRDQNNHREYSHLQPLTQRSEFEVGSLISSNSSARSCYRSVRNSGQKPTNDLIPSDSSEVDDEEFKDALNDTADLYMNENDDDEDSEDTQQQRSLLCENTTADNPSTTTLATSANLKSKEILSDSEHIPHINVGSASNLNDVGSRVEVVVTESLQNESRVVRGISGNSQCLSTSGCSKRSSFSRTTNQTTTNGISNNTMHSPPFVNKIYNVEFTFDAEVDCSIRIFYFSTKEVSSNGINYNPQHETYKSKTYYYKKGLNQKFEQPDHTFQPYMFDEDLLIYKPLDVNGNYNSGAVFPIVIHCVALRGPNPRQSQSLIATIEKMDDSYAIKPLKQLIFVDGIQYILQEIFGIENKQLIKPPLAEVNSKKTTIKKRPSYKIVSGLREKSYSLQSNLNGHHHHQTKTTTNIRPTDLDCIDKGSLASIETSSCFKMSPTSSVTKLHLYKSTENSFECVVCLAEERDTMLLPCRHLCLCGSCAQSLRYQASTCPICRCPFKAALNLRTIQKKKSSITSSSVTAIASTTFSNVAINQDCKTTKLMKSKKECKHSHSTSLKTPLSASSSFISLNMTSNEDQRSPSSKTTSFTTTPASSS